MSRIRPCRSDENDAMLAIINAAAERYRGAIPDDCWHEPYMPAEELEEQIAAGVEFWGLDEDGALAGVMGIQRAEGVDLIRHAYVAPAKQGQGIGTQLLHHLLSSATGPVLVGTWAAAAWAIGFYERHGFVQVDPKRKYELLRQHWDISDRQVETSVVLVRD